MTPSDVPPPPKGEMNMGAAEAAGASREEPLLTSAMIEAGLQVLEESGRLMNDRLSSGDGLLVQQLFQEMWRARWAVMPLPEPPK